MYYDHAKYSSERILVLINSYCSKLFLSDFKNEQIRTKYKQPTLIVCNTILDVLATKPFNLLLHLLLKQMVRFVGHRKFATG